MGETVKIPAAYLKASLAAWSWFGASKVSAGAFNYSGGHHSSLAGKPAFLEDRDSKELERRHQERIKRIKP